MATAVLLCTTDAQAQLAALDEGVALGDFTFFPSLEVRIRGEFRRHPVDVGGEVYERTAVQSVGHLSAAPTVVRVDDPVYDQWLLSERSRLGLRVEHDVVAGVFTLQDARVLGALPGAPDRTEAGGFGSLGPHEAYLDVRTAVEDPLLRVRVGRQQLVWGDGRLLGESDWSPRGAALDAGWMKLSFGDVSFELVGAMLAPPSAIAPDYVSPERQTATDGSGAPLNAEGTGAQLYGLNAGWLIVPLFNVELVGLARIARDPLPVTLTRGDTYTIDGRFHGQERGVSYAVEGAYQLGRVASYGANHDISAFAIAGRVAWQTALPGDFRFALEGGYASGDDADRRDDGTVDSGTTFERFDPIVPETHDHFGQMDLLAWSNAIEAGGEVSAKPDDELLMALGYSFLGLADPADRWTTGTLTAVGAAPDNDSAILGHEIDARLEYRPLKAVSFIGGYGLCVLGDGGKAVLGAAGRGDRDLVYSGYLQAELKAP
ncbi:MAG: alginate export family protein [Deltaproteobacteria bacterium]|nr:alginate export family protein [Deltaproteobacteria bacterium]